MCTNNILIFGLPRYFWREESGFWEKGLEKKIWGQIVHVFIVFVYWLVHESWLSCLGNCCLEWCKEGRDLRSDTGDFFFCCTFTKKCGRSPWARRWDTDTGGRALDEWGAHFSRCGSFEAVSGRCSICQHGLIHMSNNIFSLFPGQVLFVFLSRRIRIHRFTSSHKDGEALTEKSMAIWTAFLSSILFLVSFF